MFVGLLVLLFALIACGFLSLRINVGRGAGYIVLLEIVYFLFQLQLTTLALGSIGLLKPNLLFGLNVFISLVLLAFSVRKNTVHTLKHKLTTFNLGASLRSFGIPALFFLTLFLLNAATIAYRIYILPPSVWDVNTYHLIAPITWYQTEAIPMEIESPVDRINYNYLGTKIYNYWTILLDGSLTYVEVTQFLFAFLLLYVCYLLLRLLTVNRGMALIFSILAISFPTILIQMRTAHDHMSVLAMTFVLLYLLSRLIMTRRFSTLTEILNIAIVTALLVSFKINGLMYLVVFAVSLVMVMRGSLRSFPTAIKSVKITKLTGTVAVLVLVACLFVAGYWGTKNYLSGYHSFSQHYENMTTTKNTQSAAIAGSRYFKRLFLNIKVIPERILDLPSQYNPDSTNISGYGIQFFSIGLLGYIIAILLLFSNRELPLFMNVRGVVLFLVLSSFITQALYYMLYFTPYNYRLFTVFPIVGVLLAGVMFFLARPTKWQRSALYFLSFLMLSFNFVVLPTVENATPQQFAHAFSKRSPVGVVVYNDKLDDDWRLLSLLEADKVVAYYTHEDGFLLPYYDEKLRTKIISLSNYDYVIFGKAMYISNSVAEQMKTDGVDYVHINNAFYNAQYDEEYMPVDRVHSASLEHVSGGIYSVIYD